MKLKNYFFVWKTVYSKPKYVVSVFAIAIAFFMLNVLIKNFRALSAFLQEKGFFQTANLFYSMTLGFHSTIKSSGFASLIIISFLLGILLSLTAFKISSRAKSKSSRTLTALGIFLGIATPSCAACGIGVLAVLGIGAGFISAMPFGGLEISLLAIIILAFAVQKTSKGLLVCKSCQIKLKNR